MMFPRGRHGPDELSGPRGRSSARILGKDGLVAPAARILRHTAFRRQPLQELSQLQRNLTQGLPRQGAMRPMTDGGRRVKVQLFPPPAAWEGPF